MKRADIEKKLGIDMKAFNRLKKAKKKGTDKENMRFLTFEQKKQLMELVIIHPEWGAVKYASEMNRLSGKAVKEQLVVNELKRINLTTVDKRKKYSAERS